MAIDHHAVLDIQHHAHTTVVLEVTGRLCPHAISYYKPLSHLYLYTAAISIAVKSSDKLKSCAKHIDIPSREALGFEGLVA